MTTETVSILDGNTFVVTDRRGDIDASPTEPQGLFHDDTRFLSQWVLVATQEHHSVCAQTSHRPSAHSLRIAQPSRSHSLRMCSHSGENNAQTSVSAHIR